MAKPAKKERILTKPTKKAGRFANLVAHSAMHPKDEQSKKHLTHIKWNGYRG